jgi:hypothetical protein
MKRAVTAKVFSSLIAVDGGWSPYVNGTCSKTCGGGVVVQTRICTNPAPQNGGLNCTGPPAQGLPCNTQPCPGMQWEWEQSYIVVVLLNRAQTNTPTDPA